MSLVLEALPGVRSDFIRAAKWTQEDSTDLQSGQHETDLDCPSWDQPSAQNHQNSNC